MYDLQLQEYKPPNIYLFKKTVQAVKVSKTGLWGVNYLWELSLKIRVHGE